MLKYFLGLEIACSCNAIVLSQRHYTLQLLEDTSLLASKPFKVPVDPHDKLNAWNGEILPDALQYRWHIGCLLYLTLSRLGITFVLHKFSQFYTQPRTSSLVVAHNFLSYLKTILKQEIFFSNSSYNYEQFFTLIGDLVLI